MTKLIRSLNNNFLIRYVEIKKLSSLLLKHIIKQHFTIMLKAISIGITNFCYLM